MKQSFWVLILCLGVLIAPPMAAADCPQRAGSLAAFASCMAPMRGTIGMTSVVYTPGGYDEAHARLMSAMQSQAVIPPQVIPTSSPPVYPISPFTALSPLYTYGSFPMMYPMYPMMGAVAAVRGGNPAFWYVYSMYSPVVY